MDFSNPIEEDEGWKLLEQVTINDRTLIAWYNPEDSVISLMLFHLTDQPNEISKKSPYTTWGYVTRAESNIYSCEEASDVVSLYIGDIKNNNFWWENEQ